MIWLCAHFPRLPLELFARGTTRALDNVAIVLVEEHRVTQRNATAARFGIEPGCTLATAQSLCHPLVHGGRSFDAEAARLRELAELAHHFSSAITVQDPCSILLELRASLKLFGGLYRLKRQIKRLFTEVGHETALGIAHTPAAAVILARARVSGCTDANPSFELLTRASVDALRGIDIRHSDCDPVEVERLSNMGITRLGQLFDLPAAYLAKRFGTTLPRYLARLVGTRTDPRFNIVPAPSFRGSLHLLEPVNDKETLSFPMQRLINELNGWLIGRVLGVSRLRWHFSALHGTPVSLDIELTKPQQNRKNLLTVSRFELERLDLPDEILSIGLEALRLEPWEERSDELLASPGTAIGGIAASHLIDQLKARLGPSACRSLETLDDHRPERAWRQVTPTL